MITALDFGNRSSLPVSIDLNSDQKLTKSAKRRNRTKRALEAKKQIQIEEKTEAAAIANFKQKKPYTPEQVSIKNISRLSEILSTAIGFTAGCAAYSFFKYNPYGLILGGTFAGMLLGGPLLTQLKKIKREEFYPVFQGITFTSGNLGAVSLVIANLVYIIDLKKIEFECFNSVKCFTKNSSLTKLSVEDTVLYTALSVTTFCIGHMAGMVVGILSVIAVGYINFRNNVDNPRIGISSKVVKMNGLTKGYV